MIGGGPAGATAARLLASWGRRVVLLTRPSARPALAESLPPSCRKLFERVGIARAVDAAGFVRASGNTVRWGASPPRAEPFARGSFGYQVSRDALDRLMLDEAAAAGALVKRRAAVRAVDGRGRDPHDGKPAVVTYDAGSARRHIEAQWLLDCTGRAGLVARRGWRRAEPGGRTMAIVGIWARAGRVRGRWPMPDDSHTLVESYEGGWAWSVPVSAARRYVTVMVDPALTAVEGRPRLIGSYRAELARAPGHAALVEGARLVGHPFARDASSYSADRVGDSGVLLVGDSASFVDPLSSFGVKKALASAWLASVVVHSCLESPSLLEPALELYTERERTMYESLHRRMTELSRDAARAHAGWFWSERAAPGDDETGGEPDVATLRDDSDVVAALDELKRRGSIALSPTRELRRIRKAVVRGNTIALEEHLAVPAFERGVRYLRNVDLVVLANLAPAHAQVPDLFDAYNRAAPPAPLPDFLGALAVLIGKRALAFA